MTEATANDKRNATDEVEWKNLPRLFWWAVQDFTQDNGPQWAAAVAYYALLSVFPLLLAALAIASLFVKPNWAISQASSVMGSFLPAGESKIRDVVRGAFEARGGIGLFSILLLLWTGSRVFGVATQALNIAFDADEKYGLLKRTLIQLAIAAGLGLFFIVALSSRFVINLLWSSTGEQSSALSLLRQVLLRAVPGLLLLLALYLAYHLVPRRDVAGASALVGALVATILFMIARPLFLLFIERVANYNLIYGSLAIVVILVLWAFLVTNIFLYGGEMAATVQAALLEGKPREEIAERHRLRSPVRKLENVVSGNVGRKDKDDKDQKLR
jgi:membrane protein